MTMTAPKVVFSGSTAIVDGEWLLSNGLSLQERIYVGYQRVQLRKACLPCVESRSLNVLPGRESLVV